MMHAYHVVQVKYLGIFFNSRTNCTDPSVPLKKFFGSFNNTIMTVLGYGRDEMLAVHLMKSLLYGCEVWQMSSSDKVDVGLNNCFRKVCNGCWRESAKPLLFYCNSLPVTFLVEQKQMIFYKKL